MINEHLDGSFPRPVTGAVEIKFTRHNPLPIDMLGIRLEDGGRANVAVLKETSDKVGIDSRIDLVEKHGLLGKTWYQDRAFYVSLEKSRRFQGAIQIGLSIVFIYFCFRFSRRVFPLRMACVITVTCVITAISYFIVAL